MPTMNGTTCVYDVRMLKLLATLHSVHGANKSDLYQNTSEKRTLEELIARRFVEEVPTPFSNRRTCCITDRGVVLLADLAKIRRDWESDVRSSLVEPSIEDEKEDESENPLTETPLEATNEVEEVSDILEEDIVPQKGGKQAKLGDDA